MLAIMLERGRHCNHEHIGGHDLGRCLQHTALHHTAHLVSYALGFIIVSFVHIVGGELAPKVLASSDDIDRIAASGEEAEVAALHGWRREVFGDQALQLVRGEIAIRFQDRRIEVFDLPAAAE